MTRAASSEIVSATGREECDSPISAVSFRSLPLHRHRRAALSGVLAAVALLLPAVNGPVVHAEIPDSPAVHPTASSPSSPLPAVEHGGHSYQVRDGWLVDDQGRVWLSSGINVVNKHAPFTPEAQGFGADDARFLAQQGFDAVRLGFFWAAVEPQPGVYNDAYIDSLIRTTRVLEAEGIAVLIDAHQDMYHERFQGGGMPEWAVIDDGLPSTLKAGFGTSQITNIGMMRAYDNFLANRPGPEGVGLLDRYAAMWGHVASRFAEVPGVMGFDIFNEPWPGSHWFECYATGVLGPFAPQACVDPNRQLTEMHQKALHEIRKTHSAPVFYEPFATQNSGFDSHVVPPKGDNVVISFHNYCLFTGITGKQWGCDVPDSFVHDAAQRQRERYGVAPVMTEFGATDDPQVLSASIDQARKHLVGYFYWAYAAWNDPASINSEKQGMWRDDYGPRTLANAKVDKIRLLQVPRIRLIAGTPTAQTWDPVQRIATAEWSSDASDDAYGATTEVVVPLLWYPDGYRIIVTGGDVVSGSESAQQTGREGTDRIQIRAHKSRPGEDNPTGATKVTVRIEPR